MTNNKPKLPLVRAEKPGRPTKYIIDPSTLAKALNQLTDKKEQKAIDNGIENLLSIRFNNKLNKDKELKREMDDMVTELCESYDNSTAELHTLMDVLKDTVRIVGNKLISVTMDEVQEIIGDVYPMIDIRKVLKSDEDVVGIIRMLHILDESNQGRLCKKVLPKLDVYFEKFTESSSSKLIKKFKNEIGKYVKIDYMAEFDSIKDGYHKHMNKTNEVEDKVEDKLQQVDKVIEENFETTGVDNIEQVEEPEVEEQVEEPIIEPEVVQEDEVISHEDGTEFDVNTHGNPTLDKLDFGAIVEDTTPLDNGEEPVIEPVVEEVRQVDDSNNPYADNSDKLKDILQEEKDKIKNIGDDYITQSSKPHGRPVSGRGNRPVPQLPSGYIESKTYSNKHNTYMNKYNMR